MGDVQDFTNFMAAVIDGAAFQNIKSYIEFAANSSEAEILAGGGCDDSVGYFIEPTIVLTTNPRFKLMEEEIFGPVLTIFVYDDEDLEGALELCNATSPYGLTGSIFAQDRYAIEQMTRALTHAAGNFYERQTNWCSGRAAAVRRQPGFWNQRQGWQYAESAALGVPEGHKGKPASSETLRLPPHGRSISKRRRTAPLL